jgi:sugar phosphate isomerase/epimerase
LTPAAIATRIACADSSFPRLSHAAALAVIGDLGIIAVDVCVFAGYEHTTPAAVDADPVAVAESVAGRLAAEGLVASDVFAILAEDFETLAVNHPDAAVREESRRQFDRVLEFAVRLGAPGLTILPGAPWPGSRGSSWRQPSSSGAPSRRRRPACGSRSSPTTDRSPRRRPLPSSFSSWRRTSRSPSTTATSSSRESARVRSTR